MTTSWNSKSTYGRASSFTFSRTHKLIFLHVYAFPVIIAAYYLDLRKTLLGALCCILLTAANIRFSPESFQGGVTITELYLNLVGWGCILLLVAILVSRLKDRRSK